MDEGIIIGEYDVMEILNKISDILITESNIVTISSPVVICGDVHGQYEDVKRLFEVEGSPKDNRYLFMGDYVDRGHFSLNTFLLLATYKIERPDDFWLLRGNHESRQVTQQYGFQQEIRTRYGHTGIWSFCMKVFDLLPVAAIVDKDVFSVHGGISPELVYYGELEDKERKRELSEHGVFADLTWSDPTKDPIDWKPNPRGAGYLYGESATAKFCVMNRLKLITRSHQLVQAGFEWHFPDNEKQQFPGRLLNVWSAPNYGYSSGNMASVLQLRFPGQDTFNLPTFEDVKEGRIDQEPLESDPQTYFD
jgi:diadenosine tetraphosphatase ApaH/serine/threonine PP2A family protein phosphatase